MKISEVLICWMPKGEGSVGLQGKFRVYLASHPDTALFNRQAGAYDTNFPTKHPDPDASAPYEPDPRVHDPDPMVRATYVQEVARRMVADGCAAPAVFSTLATDIDDYRDLTAVALLSRPAA